jgi:GTPase SAR1 family protein
MAGSGKTTLIQRINSHMHQQQLNGYIINLDPAVSHLPYGANIDIRDTVSVLQDDSGCVMMHRQAGVQKNMLPGSARVLLQLTG